jgi:nitroreductase
VGLLEGDCVMVDTLFETWQLVEAGFPRNETPADKLSFLLRYAVRAPSGHNTQPWLFHMTGEAGELHADRRRAMPAVDPGDRELIMSCGAALLHLRVALGHFGYAGEVTLFPDKHKPDYLARISLGTPALSGAEDELLFRAIPHRHTYRLPFEPRSVPDSLQTALQQAATAEGASLRVIANPARQAVMAALIAAGEAVQSADAGFREDLAVWMRANRDLSGDGLPGYAFGFGDVTSYFLPFLMRKLDLLQGQVAKDQALATAAPLLAVLETPADTPVAWLAAGQAVARVLLRASVDGVAASFLNSPIEVAELRARLGRILDSVGYPQLLLRLGYAPEGPPTPRREVSAVLI